MKPYYSWKTRIQLAITKTLIIIMAAFAINGIYHFARSFYWTATGQCTAERQTDFVPCVGAQR